ncbi:MAG: hypothetical protein DI533_11270 [Cereibacter sphaeroides]|uniref:Outer membrane protein assembly factor n=1 Tax=Cereibacter sphaeroides TaxID=1063 RepID=A0A2W5S3X0_CERSP|nr:MAG: hypothetical protein DI533_11270 [Cereibacter sphaeroides]
MAFAAALAPIPVVAQDKISFRTPGAPKDLAETLRRASALLAAESEGRNDPQDIFAAAQAEYGALLAALYATGRYAPVIHVKVDGQEAANIPALSVPRSIRQVVVTVESGPVFAFSKAELVPIAPKTKLPSGFAVGKPAETGVIRDAVKVGIDGWRSVGYAKAKPGTQSLVVDVPQAELSAAIALEPGRQLRFGKFMVTGEQRMRPDRIRAIAGFPEGEIFDPEKLTKSSDRLRRTGVFRSVSMIEAEAPNPDGTLNINTTVVENLPRSYGFGGEVSTLDGVNLSAYWVHRNLWGGGERLRFDAAVENVGAQDNGVDYHIGVTLERPATFTPDTTLSYSANAARLDDGDGEIIDLVTAGASLTQFVSDNLTLRAGIELRAQDVTDDSGKYQYYNLALPLGLTYDGRNDKFNPSKGYFVAAGLTPFVGFDQTQSGARVTLDARGYKGFGADAPVVLAGRFQLGSIYGAELIHTPRDYLFYSGGAGTVRGHAYQSLGVYVISPEQQTGGTKFLAISAEIRARVSEKIGVVGFYDAGAVGVDQFIDDPQGGWQSGAGIGLRYLTGFGPIRVDLAAPITGVGGDGVQLYVGIGQAF